MTPKVATCTAKQAQALAARGIPLSHALAMSFDEARGALEALAELKWKATPAWLEKWGGPNVFKLRPDLAPGYKPPQPVERSDVEIVAQTNRLARAFYLMLGYEVADDHRFYDFERKNYHPQERMCWTMACLAQTELTDTDPDDALANLD